MNLSAIAIANIEALGGEVQLSPEGKLRGRLNDDARRVLEHWRDHILWFWGVQAFGLWKEGSEYIHSPFATWVSGLYDAASVAGVRGLARAIDDAAIAGDRATVLRLLRRGELLMVAIEFEPRAVSFDGL